MVSQEFFYTLNFKYERSYDSFSKKMVLYSEMKGSCSIKQALPALVPELSH